MREIQIGGHRRNSTNKLFSKIDDEDYEKVSKYKWSILKNKFNKVYACRQYKYNGKLVRVFLHRIIMNVVTNEKIDHIDGDSLNNQKINLRKCTNIENTYNQKTSVRNTSGYKGVHWNKNKWRVVIQKDRKKYYFGVFEDIEEAKTVYNSKAKELFGNFAELNKERYGNKTIKHTK